MNTHTKLSATARIALGATAFLFITPIVSAEEQDDILVQQDAEMTGWQEQTTAELNRALGRPPSARARPGNAIVQVTFVLDENGMARDLEFYNREGNRHAKSMAVRAIKRLKNLGNVPVAAPQDARFMANIIFADDRAKLESLSERLETMEAERLASTGGERTYIALNR
jgi:hypothetical protein